MLADESLEVTGSPGLGTEAGRPGPGCAITPNTHLADTESEDNGHELNCTEANQASK